MISGSDGLLKSGAMTRMPAPEVWLFVSRMTTSTRYSISEISPVRLYSVAVLAIRPESETAAPL